VVQRTAQLNSIFEKSPATKRDIREFYDVPHQTRSLARGFSRSGWRAAQIAGST
jgi:hypothetical protein